MTGKKKVVGQRYEVRLLGLSIPSELWHLAVPIMSLA